MKPKRQNTKAREEPSLHTSNCSAPFFMPTAVLLNSSHRRKRNRKRNRNKCRTRTPKRDRKNKKRKKNMVTLARSNLSIIYKLHVLQTRGQGFECNRPLRAQNQITPHGLCGHLNLKPKTQPSTRQAVESNQLFFVVLDNVSVLPTGLGPLVVQQEQLHRHR